MAAGEFNLSALPDVLLRADELYLAGRSRNELSQPLDSAKALLENQMVQFVPVMTGRTCVGVKAAWLKSCNETVSDCNDTPLASCEINGVQIESDSMDFPTNGCLVNEFAVYDDQCKDLFQWSEKMAYAFEAKKHEMEKKINTAVIAFLIANAQANAYTQTSGTIVGTETTFTAGEWTPDILAELDLTTIFNDLNNPVMLSGTLLRNYLYNATFEKLADCCGSDAAKFAAWNMYWDPKNVDTVAGGQAAFLFDAGAAAFYPKNQFENEAPQNMMDDKNTHVFSMPLTNLDYRDGNQVKDVRVDVYTQRKCTIASNGVARWGTHVRLQLQYGLHVGPTDCNDGTGILQFGVTAE